jgi:hypothetical protein
MILHEPIIEPHVLFVREIEALDEQRHGLHKLIVPFVRSPVVKCRDDLVAKFVARMLGAFLFVDDSPDQLASVGIESDFDRIETLLSRLEVWRRNQLVRLCGKSGNDPRDDLADSSSQRIIE